MRELALFAGAGGGILGGILCGFTTVCAVEINPYCQRVLMQRQDDGALEPFPIWPDITTFDGRPWRGLIDVISGGFPCQDISAAGSGSGITGERSGLWSEMARVIREVEPQHVLVENSPMLTSRGLDVVLGDLATMGYDARWGVFSAAGVGADHLRQRIWIRAALCRQPQGYSPTPTAHQFGSTPEALAKRQRKHGRVSVTLSEWLTLPQAPAAPPMWPTPQAHDATRGYAKRVGRYGTEHGAMNLNDSIAKAEGLAAGMLNPPWVEWLMGWPINWTDCAPLEMDRFQQWLRAHGGN